MMLHGVLGGLGYGGWVAVVVCIACDLGVCGHGFPLWLLVTLFVYIYDSWFVGLLWVVLSLLC